MSQTGLMKLILKNFRNKTFTVKDILVIDDRLSLTIVRKDLTKLTVYGFLTRNTGGFSSNRSYTYKVS